MTDSLARLAQLRQIAAGRTAAPVTVAALLAAHAPLQAELHEVHAATAEDAAAAIGFALALVMAAGAVPMLWMRTGAAQRRGGRLLAAGVAELGLDPATLMTVIAADEAALLRCAADAAGCPGLGALLIETWGAAPPSYLTAMRRLVLAAEASGAVVVSLRLDAAAGAGTAANRWRVAAAPTTGSTGTDLPGRPAFTVECLRRRSGAAGGFASLEWNRAAQCFDPPLSAVAPDDGMPAAPRRAAPRRPLAGAPLSGAGLSVAAGRAAAR